MSIQFCIYIVERHSLLKHYLHYYNYDLLFLGGNRLRYGRFGFENAGRKFVFNISQRTKHRLKPESFEVIKLNKDDHKEIETCLSLYNKSSQRMLRTKENFYNHVINVH